MITSNGDALGKGRKQLNLDWSTGRDEYLLQVIFHLYISDAILMIPSMSISISTTTATELLENLTTSNVIQLMNRQSYI